MAASIPASLADMAAMDLEALVASRKVSIEPKDLLFKTLQTHIFYFHI